MSNLYSLRGDEYPINLWRRTFVIGLPLEEYGDQSYTKPYSECTLDNHADEHGQVDRRIVRADLGRQNQKNLTQFKSVRTSLS